LSGFEDQTELFTEGVGEVMGEGFVESPYVLCPFGRVAVRLPQAEFDLDVFRRLFIKTGSAVTRVIIRGRRLTDGLTRD
jgi:hypothetical protein